MISTEIEARLRELAPQVLGVLVRRYGRFDACEDAVQEALLAATTSWGNQPPDHPAGWLITAASRRLIEMWRQESARRNREVRYTRMDLEAVETGDRDDTLALYFLCCHPAVTPSAQIPLILRALGGLTTVEIADGLLIPAPTVGQRISRAKARIAEAGGTFADPGEDELAERLPAVLQAIYLIFNEGYTASSGPTLQRVELATEAIRLARGLHQSRPGDGEVTGLLALLLLTDARRSARTRGDGSLIPLSEQDRSCWNRAQIEEGATLLTTALTTAPIGPYQVQAAIAAVHGESAEAGDTDWRQILTLYDLLEVLSPGPVVTLNRVVALAEVHGPEVGLRALGALDSAPLATHHRTHAVRAHLLEQLGDRDGAREHYLQAARGTRSLPEQRYLLARAARLQG